MAERVSLIEIYSALRENNISKQVAAAVATATHRVMNEAKQKSTYPLVAALRRNAQFACITLAFTTLGLAIIHLLGTR